MEAEIHKSTYGSNPILAIGTAIGVAIAMVSVTFTLFIHSGAYKTVKQIQVGTKLARSIKVEGYDSKSPIKATDITTYQLDLNKRLNKYNNQADFNPAVISDSALGL